MTTVQRIIALSQAIGADIKALTTKQGDLTTLSTTTKTSLVLAVNELFTLVGAAGAIDDASGDGVLTKTWSANKIYDAIEAAKTAVKTEILGGASAAYDTLGELQAIVLADEGLASAMATSISNRVRFDAAQSLTTGEKLQACNNIGIGDPDYNFVTDYNTAKA
jgi:hypothetical protein